jgi:catechol 2,3-dioxygenase-like lactoylglutathione lyase family enzyme
MAIARELRFALVVDDYDAGIALFRDALGLEIAEAFDEQAGRGALFRVPAASLEVLDGAHSDWVDEIEIGRPLGRRVRVAVRVDDLDAAGEAAEASGARPLADAVETPWGDRNRRFELAGLQLTLFRSV